jgi:hypothetical protein
MHIIFVPFVALSLGDRRRFEEKKKKKIDLERSRLVLSPPFETESKSIGLSTAAPILNSSNTLSITTVRGQTGEWAGASATAMAAEHGDEQVMASSILKDGDPLRDPVLFHNAIFAFPSHIQFQKAGRERGEWRRDNIDTVITLSALIVVWQCVKADEKKKREGGRRLVSFETLPRGLCFPGLSMREWERMRLILANWEQAKVVCGLTGWMFYRGETLMVVPSD